MTWDRLTDSDNQAVIQHTAGQLGGVQRSDTVRFVRRAEGFVWAGLHFADMQKFEVILLCIWSPPPAEMLHNFANNLNRLVPNIYKRTRGWVQWRVPVWVWGETQVSEQEGLWHHTLTSSVCVLRSVNQNESVSLRLPAGSWDNSHMFCEAYLKTIKECKWSSDTWSLPSR